MIGAAVLVDFQSLFTVSGKLRMYAERLQDLDNDLCVECVVLCNQNILAVQKPSFDC